MNVPPGGHTVIVARDLGGEFIVDQGVVQIPSGYAAQLTCTNLGCIGLTTMDSNGPVLSSLTQSAPVSAPFTAPSVSPRGVPVCTTSDVALPSGLEEAGSSVVLLTSAAGRRTAGVVVEPSGGILTAAAGQRMGDTVSVRLPTGISLPGTITAWDGVADLARVDVQASGLPCRPLFADDVAVGSTVYTVGVPPAPGLARVMSSGLVGGYLDRPEGRLLQTDTRVSPHLEGAPVLDVSGRVVGVASAVDRGFGQDVSMAVSGQTIARWFAATLPSQAPGGPAAEAAPLVREPVISQEQIDAWNAGAPD